MRIGIDGRWISWEGSGIGTYSRALLEALVRIDSAEHSFVWLFHDRRVLERTVAETGVGNDPRVECVLLPYGALSLRSQALLPRRLRQQRLDVFHSTNFMIPLAAFPPNHSGKIRCVTTIHDMIPMQFPEAAPRSKKTRWFTVYRRLLQMAAARSDRILTVSEASRTQILQGLALPASTPSKVRVIYNGVGPEFTPGGAPSDNANRTRTVLYVGRADPHKNLVGLIRGFARARGRARFGMRLEIVGPTDELQREPMRLIHELGIADAVVWTGHLPQDDLVRAYREADVFCLPSRFEGFGLPVVEAMAAGTPVVCSNTGSLPEVAGDGALQIDPDDPEALAGALIEVLSNPALAHSLVERGHAQAAKFSWTKTAQQTMAVYEELTPRQTERVSS